MVGLRTIIHEILNSLFPWKMCFIPSMFKFSCLFLTLIQKDRSSIFALSVLPSNSLSFSDRNTFFLQMFTECKLSKYLRIVSPTRLYLERKSKFCILYMYNVIHSVRSIEKHSDIQSSMEGYCVRRGTKWFG